jgi:hypothetical protein
MEFSTLLLVLLVVCSVYLAGTAFHDNWGQAREKGKVLLGVRGKGVPNKLAHVSK